MSAISLVAGGAGFVGFHLCERLLRDGGEVICLDNLSSGRRANVDRLRRYPRFTFVAHDIVRPLPSLPAVAEIFHLASPASPPGYQQIPVETLRVNGEGTRRLLDLAVRDGARFLYVSSSEVYGDPVEHPQREDYHGNVDPVGPRSMYDEGKRYGEALTAAYADARGVETRIARVFNTYGPRMDAADGRVVTNLIGQALSGQPLTVYGDGSQTRSFQYIDDLVEALVRLMASDYRGPVNLGNPEEYTILELAELIRELTASDSPIVFAPLPGDDPKQRRPDISLARRLLAWEPTIPVTHGLRRTVAHYRQELAGVRGQPAMPAKPPAAIVEASWRRHAGRPGPR